MLAENWKDFIKPSNLVCDQANDNKSAVITVEPLERGFGTTVGSALRRILLSSIYGTAITAVKIDGVIHEQDTVKGLSQDIIDVILNIKKVVLSSDVAVKKRATIDVKGPCVVTAKMISFPEGVELVNPDQVICSLDNNSTLKAEFVVESGKGYRDSAQVANENKEIGLINIDAVFSPVRRVSFSVESSRVGEVIDYDKLVLKLDTDGSIEPNLAVGIAAKIMKEQMALFINFDDETIAVAEESKADDKPDFNPVLIKKVDELELSVRSQNCLKSEDIIYLGDLVTKSENDMLKTPNFGRKSLNEIKAILQTMDLDFDMDIDNWPPENIDSIATNTNDNQ